jgi:hypothetical protein
MTRGYAWSWEDYQTCKEEIAQAENARIPAPAAARKGERRRARSLVGRPGTPREGCVAGTLLSTPALRRARELLNMGFQLPEVCLAVVLTRAEIATLEAPPNDPA